MLTWGPSHLSVSSISQYFRLVTKFNMCFGTDYVNLGLDNNSIQMLSLKNKKIRIKIIEVTSDYFLEITSEEFHEIANTDGVSHTVSLWPKCCLLFPGALPPSKAHPGSEEVSQGRKGNGLPTFAHLNVQKCPQYLSLQSSFPLPLSSFRRRPLSTPWSVSTFISVSASLEI